ARGASKGLRGLAARLQGGPVLHSRRQASRTGRWSLCVLCAGALLFGGPARAQDVIPPAKPPPELTKPPGLEHFVEAAYPEAARASGLQARVLLEVDISATGEVTHATVLTPAGHGFDEAALAAVQQFHFTPAEVDGKPAAVRINYVYHFVLTTVVKELPQQGAVNLAGTVLER